MTETQQRGRQYGRGPAQRRDTVADGARVTILDRAKASFETDLAAIKGDLIAMLGPTIDVERWLSVATDAVLSKPDLLTGDRLSLISALRTSAKFGLEPVGELGEGCIVPYKDGAVSKAQFQAMYRGLRKLAMNSGDVVAMDAQMVYANDKLDYQLGTEGYVRHVPTFGPRGDRLGAYAWAKMRSGEVLIEILPVAEIETVRAVSKSFRRAVESGSLDSIWHKWPDEMAKKTATRRLCKKLPLSIVARSLLAYDDTADAIEGHAVRVPLAQITGRAADALTRVQGRKAPEPAQDGPSEAPEAKADEEAATPPDDAQRPSQSVSDTPEPGVQGFPPAELCGWRLGRGSGKPMLSCTKQDGHLRDKADRDHSWQEIALHEGGRVEPPLPKEGRQ